MSTQILDNWLQCDECGKWRRVTKAMLDDEPAWWTCSMNDDPQHSTCEDPEEQPETSAPEVYKVQELLDVKSEGNKRRYLVHWKGYPSAEATWEAEGNILDRRLVDEFERRRDSGSHAPGLSAKRRAVPYVGKAAKEKRPRPASAHGAKPVPVPAGPLPPAEEPPAVEVGLCQRIFGGQSRVGTEWQASPLPSLRIALSAPDMLPPPPMSVLRRWGEPCGCGEPTVWKLGRWWCALEEEGCGFEREPPPETHAPPCHCGDAAIWLRGHWWCRRFKSGLTGSAGDGAGCDFTARPDARSEPTFISCTEIEAELSAGAAVRALAAANGTWVGDFCCVAETEGCGLGLFARAPLVPKQVITEYGGPRLPLSMLGVDKGEYALEVTGTSNFIDGIWHNSPLADAADAAEGRRFRPRYPAIFANHSATPNAQFERRPVYKPRALELRHRMVLVALEPIARGVGGRLSTERAHDAPAAPRMHPC